MTVPTDADRAFDDRIAQIEARRFWEDLPLLARFREFGTDLRPAWEDFGRSDGVHAGSLYHNTIPRSQQDATTYARNQALTCFDQRLTHTGLQGSKAEDRVIYYSIVSFLWACYLNAFSSAFNTAKTTAAQVAASPMGRARLAGPPNPLIPGLSQQQLADLHLNRTLPAGLVEQLILASGQGQHVP